MSTDVHVKRFRSESPIIGKGSIGPLREGFAKKDAHTLQGLLLQRRGSDQEPGKYFYGQGNVWKTCILQEIKEKLAVLEEQWQRHVQNRVNIGEKAPTEWPKQLQDQKDRLEAQLYVTQQEIEVLQDLLAEAETKKRDLEYKKVPPSYWGAGRLHNNVLVEFCGWNVSKNDEGTLAIDDPESDFNTMEIWRFKSQVVNPLHAENRLRQREEAAAAESENRKRKNIMFPPVPSYNQETDTIEYPQSWHSSTIQKIKHSD